MNSSWVSADAKELSYSQTPVLLGCDRFAFAKKKYSSQAFTHVKIFDIQTKCVKTIPVEEVTQDSVICSGDHDDYFLIKTHKNPGNQVDLYSVSKGKKVASYSDKDICSFANEFLLVTHRGKKQFVGFKGSNFYEGYSLGLYDFDGKTPSFVIFKTDPQYSFVGLTNIIRINNRNGFIAGAKTPEGVHKPGRIYMWSFSQPNEPIASFRTPFFRYNRQRAAFIIPSAIPYEILIEICRTEIQTSLIHNFDTINQAYNQSFTINRRVRYTFKYNETMAYLEFSNGFHTLLPNDTQDTCQFVDRDHRSHKWYSNGALESKKELPDQEKVNETKNAVREVFSEHFPKELVELTLKLCDFTPVSLSKHPFTLPDHVLPEIELVEDIQDADEKSLVSSAVADEKSQQGATTKNDATIAQALAEESSTAYAIRALYITNPRHALSAAADMKDAAAPVGATAPVTTPVVVINQPIVPPPNTKCSIQ